LSLPILKRLPPNVANQGNRRRLGTVVSCVRAFGYWVACVGVGLGLAACAQHPPGRTAEQGSPEKTTPAANGEVSSGTVTASGDAVPEGRLVLQLQSGIEVLAQGDGRSLSLGVDAIVAYDVSPDVSNVLAATYVTEPTNYTREDQLLAIDPLTGDRTVLVRADPKEDLGPAVWSPDGQRVAYRLTVLPVDPALERPEGTVEQTVCVVDAVTTTSQCFPDLGTVDGFDWSPDGRRIAVDGVGADLPLRLLDVETGAVSDFASPLDPNLVAALGGEPPRSFVDVDWSASGEFVATQAHLVVAAIFDSESRFVMIGHRTEEFADVLAWSPTEDLLAYAIGRPSYAITHLYVLDPASGEDRLLYSTGEGEAAPIIVDVAWSPSGRWLAVTVVERTIYLPMSVHVIDITGEDPSSTVDLGASEAEVLAGWGP
jgi:dipeptidyl aminopeptidase/acylaminoacyl peptidase